MLYGIAMGLLVVILVTIKILMITFIVIAIQVLIKALLIVAMISLCYAIWRIEMPKQKTVCDWCGNGISANSEDAIRLHITKLDYLFDTNECLVRWLYSRMIIKLENYEKLEGT